MRTWREGINSDGSLEANLVATLGEFPIRPEPPAGRAERIGMEADEGHEDIADDTAATTAFITYCDASGEPSARTITFRSLAMRDGRPESILSWCHARGAIRRFRFDRIEEMMCPETGEMLDPLEHCLQLKRDGALKVQDFVLIRMMRIVTFMARCDGELHALEKSHLEDVLGRYFRFFGGDDAEYECAIREAKRLAPGSRDFTRSINYLLTQDNRQELARFAIDACGGMMDADGHHRDEEVRWGIEAGNLLRQAAARS